jgi:hypothetical protein
MVVVETSPTNIWQGRTVNLLEDIYMCGIFQPTLIHLTPENPPKSAKPRISRFQPPHSERCRGKATGTGTAKERPRVPCPRPGEAGRTIRVQDGHQMSQGFNVDFVGFHGEITGFHGI